MLCLQVVRENSNTWKRWTDKNLKEKNRKKMKLDFTSLFFNELTLSNNNGCKPKLPSKYKLLELKGFACVLTFYYVCMKETFRNRATEM